MAAAGAAAGAALPMAALMLATSILHCFTLVCAKRDATSGSYHHLIRTDAFRRLELAKRVSLEFGAVFLLLSVLDGGGGGVFAGVLEWGSVNSLLVHATDVVSTGRRDSFWSSLAIHSVLALRLARLLVATNFENLENSHGHTVRAALPDALVL